MIQEILPYKFDNSYKNIEANIGDFYICFNLNNQILLIKKNNKLEIPTLNQKINSRYLFSIDSMKFFYVLYDELYALNEDYAFYQTSVLRDLEPNVMAYAAFCGKHYHYYLSHAKYCGVCGSQMVKSLVEQAQICPSCQNAKYPDIMPAIIVAITFDSKLLLTKYAHGSYKKYALVAGYVEIGETLEECVKREALEEVGLELYDIKYYKSQPWGLSNTMMVGFTAKAKSNVITLQESELSEATWFSASEIEMVDNPISIGHELINSFKLKKWN